MNTNFCMSRETTFYFKIRKKIYIFINCCTVIILLFYVVEFDNFKSSTQTLIINFKTLFVELFFFINIIVQNFNLVLNYYTYITFLENIIQEQNFNANKNVLLF